MVRTLNFFAVKNFVLVYLIIFRILVIHLGSIDFRIHIFYLRDLLNHLWYLDHLIHQKVSPRVQKLLKTTSEGNKGVVIKPWNWDHHAFYNLKVYYSYRHHQDPDVVLDYQNSDLVF